ncbi:SAM hydrolase/SAM-dependent halogenase family protein [Aciditerrimonas ferrireducens]|uniref:SAM hydrolase/SAM-dependent halogenase family protein n=1 Tax=Aciditerrimonas ferrireducens TaxID=667306 RepID=UPI002006311A|nr:SAM-dependent chlorinase/fluorinase [Aciditerrimonas ferrireducens]MCK4176935.1 SAM-dependent chlorinase/fluorinase [Aciditerrimonas ferrireducens]
MPGRAASPGPGAIFLLTDYGLQDEFVGMLHAAIRRLAPLAPVVDLTHGIPPFDVVAGSRALVRCAPHLGPGVLVGVVDPGVGTARRPVALGCPGRPGPGGPTGPTRLVGPDNGLLLGAAEVLGGVVEAVELPRPTRSVTFDGRDVFAPAAARLWAGEPLGALGPPLDPVSLVDLPSPWLASGEGWLEAEVLWVDRFGNLQLAARPEDLADAGLGSAGVVLLEHPGGQQPLVRVGAFEELRQYRAPHGAPALGLLVDANGQLAVVEDRGSAASTLGLAAGQRLRLRGAPGAPPERDPWAQEAR